MTNIQWYPLKFPTHEDDYLHILEINIKLDDKQDLIEVRVYTF